MLKITTDATEDGHQKLLIMLLKTESQLNLNTHMSEETNNVKNKEEPSKSDQLKLQADVLH